jgi:DnaJ homolog subfamily A member 5
MQGFFFIYRNLFSRLQSEEAMFGSDADYPSFGYSKWPWSTEMKKRIEADGAAREFYTVWSNFATEKDFAWVEQWKLSEAPDRRVRRCVHIHLYITSSTVLISTNRLMEKDNKKARDDARREYNDTVRTLVKFLRRRDPRFAKFSKEQDELSASKQAQAKASSSAQRANLAESYVEQPWQKASAGQSSQADLEWSLAEGDDDQVDWECVACNKVFRSEAAWDSHERSKKHLKEIEKLRMEMEMDDEELELQEALEDEAALVRDALADGDESKGVESDDEEEDYATPQASRPTSPPLSKSPSPAPTSAKADKDDDSSEEIHPLSKLPKSKTRGKKKKGKPAASPPDEGEDEESLAMPLSKTERRALRREKLNALNSQPKATPPASGTQTPASSADKEDADGEAGSVKGEEEDDGPTEVPVKLSAAAQKRAKRAKGKGGPGTPVVDADSTSGSLVGPVWRTSFKGKRI